MFIGRKAPHLIHNIPNEFNVLVMSSSQDFAHPQARFLHEKMWQLSPRRGSTKAYLLGCINRVSYTAIQSAMAMGVVRY